MESLRKRILRFLQNPAYKPVNQHDLSEMLNVDKENLDRFTSTVQAMIDEQILEVGKNSHINLPRSTDFVRGTYRATRHDFGFVSPLVASADGDLRIEKEQTKGACDGDIVEAKVVNRRRFNGKVLLAGKVTKIIERAKTNSTGTVYQNGKLWRIVPDGTFFKAPFIVDDITAKGAKQEDKVYFEVLEYPRGKVPGRAVILEVIGRAGLYDTEIAATIKNFELHTEFSKECSNQAKKAAKTEFKPGQGYDDIRDKIIITIDPDDAKDFDDAISLEYDEDNNPVLGVHIADVSRFVTQGSPLDIEASLRGNSVYLPGKVLPMLPEILSNGVCSLQPNQPRYAKSAYITYDAEGNVIESKTRFANSLIQSNARLTYLQANAMLAGEKLDFSPEAYELLKNMDKLAKVIEQRRKRAGMLHLDLPDIDLVLNEDGEVVDANPADESYPHTIIEMFMVEANEAVARLIDKYNLPFIRRIHPEPDIYGMQKLADFIGVCGLKLPKDPDRESLRAILDKARGTGIEYAVNNAVLRSLQKAVYSPENIGHYALASRHYTHFTSPIRRYADLTIHRLLSEYLKNGKLNGKMDIPSESDLVAIGSHISKTEDQADKAERDLKKVLILLMLEKKIGEKLHCYVSGVIRKGIFVQCKKFGIEGFIPSQELGNDKWEYHEKSQTLTGVQSGIKVCIGFEIDVTITKVTVPIREIVLLPVEPLVNNPDFKPEKGKKFKNKRKEDKKTPRDKKKSRRKKKK